MRQAGLFGLSDHLERLSKDGDPLEVLEATVAFEYFRGWLVEGLGSGRACGRALPSAFRLPGDHGIGVGVQGRLGSLQAALQDIVLGVLAQAQEDIDEARRATCSRVCLLGDILLRSPCDWRRPCMPA